jgi:hypothetical protein
MIIVIVIIIREWRENSEMKNGFNEIKNGHNF